MPRKPLQRQHLRCVSCSEKLSDQNTQHMWQRRCDSCVEIVRENRKKSNSGRPAGAKSRK